MAAFRNKDNGTWYVQLRMTTDKVANAQGHNEREKESYLKNRLTRYAMQYPSECRLIDDDENGCLTFEIRKGRFCFKLTAPYSEERRKAAGELAKKENLRRNGK